MGRVTSVVVYKDVSYLDTFWYAMFYWHSCINV